MIRKSKPKDSLANSSNVVCAMPIQGTSESFFVGDNFQENLGEDNPEVRIACLGRNFKKWFGPLVESIISGRVIDGVDITKSLYDGNILSVKTRKKMPILMVSEIFTILRDCPLALIADGYENGHANLFYAKDAHRKLRVISINKLETGLVIEAYSIGFMKWLFGSRVFRPACEAVAQRA